MRPFLHKEKEAKLVKAFAQAARAIQQTDRRRKVAINK
jgi:hypothetical protein